MKKVKLLATIMLISSLLVFTSYADWQKDASGRYKYLNETNNQYVVNNWVQVGNNFYFFDTNGYAVTGWYLINGKYYLFGDNYLMQTGFNEFALNNYVCMRDYVTLWIKKDKIKTKINPKRIYAKTKIIGDDYHNKLYELCLTGDCDKVYEFIKNK